jgi:hypothetical protein
MGPVGGSKLERWDSIAAGSCAAIFQILGVPCRRFEADDDCFPRKALKTQRKS